VKWGVVKQTVSGTFMQSIAQDWLVLKLSNASAYNLRYQRH